MENTELSNDIIDVIDYIVDKFNIKLDITTQQTTEFAKQFVNKILMWKIAGCIIQTLICIALIIIICKIFKRYEYKLGKIALKKADKMLYSIDISNAEQSNNATANLIITIILYAILLALGITIIDKVVKLILCIIFPEKVVLDFISVYIR